VLNNYRPAFIGFQELIASYIPDITSGCPGYVYYGIGRDAGGGGESCRIFYLTSDWRIDSSNAGTFWLSLTPNVPGSMSWGTGSTRICTHARFINRTTGVGFYVFNTHLDNASELARTNGIHMIADSIAARTHTEEPFVLTGDFNANESSAAVVYLKQGAANPVLMTDSYRLLYPSDPAAGTFHGFTGQGGVDKIDYIMSLKNGYKAIAAEIIKYNVNNLYPSDHFPVYADLNFTYPNMATLVQP
jgi:endonuclease/exonuclease/phosphatase family metal-dependent hydrolase